MVLHGQQYRALSFILWAYMGSHSVYLLRDFGNQIPGYIVILNVSKSFLA
jgi:hypothetical protein